MKIPFSPPFINDAVKNEVLESLESGWITTGPKVKKLESQLAEFTESPEVLCVNSWTSGALLMLKWFGLEAGDEVIIPAYTYSATALAVIHAGGKPVMVDIEEDFNISVRKIEEAITEKTKVIMPVDIAGWPCDYKEINALVQKKRSIFTAANKIQETLGRILVISDAAHSLGATYDGKQSGVLTDITIFSLHAVKNITTAEGGAICLNLPSPFNNGEISLRGVRENVLVIRDFNGTKVYNRIDLTSKNMTKSPVYYLTQNDVVYVEPNSAGIRETSISQSTTILVSVILTIMTTTAIIITRN